MEYQSPGFAASNALEDYLMKQKALERQNQLDQMAVERFRQETENHKADLELRRQAMEEHANEFKQSLGEKKIADFFKKTAALGPGDVADPDLIKEADELGLSSNFPTTQAPAQQSDEMAPITQPAPVRTFIGSPAQREKAQKDVQIKVLTQRLATAEPNSPEYIRAATEYGMLTGKPLTPAEMRPTVVKPNTKPVYIHDSQTGKVYAPDGTEATEVPANATVVSKAVPPQPKDTSAADDRKNNTRIRVYDTQVKALDEIAKPARAAMEGVSGLTDVLDQHTPQADTLVAPLVLKMTVAGTGSGFRMTRAEIDNVLHGRSKWEDLKASLQKWNTDPSKANQLTEPQRQQLRDLATAIREKAARRLKVVDDTRNALDTMDDYRDIQRSVSQLRHHIDSEENDKGSTDQNSNGLPIVGGSFGGGKVLKVTPIK